MGLLEDLVKALNRSAGKLPVFQVAINFLYLCFLRYDVTKY
jgi:hypothetical protein